MPKRGALKIETFFAESRVFGLFRDYQRLEEEVVRSLREQRLSFRQALLLVAIYVEKDGVGPGALVAAFRLPKSQISEGISALESRGFVRRCLDESDGRRIRLELTARGRAFGAPLMSLFEVFERDLDANFRANVRLK